MFFEETFSQNHVVFGISDEGEHGRHAQHIYHQPITERQHTMVKRLLFEAIFVIFCEISSIILWAHSALHAMSIRCRHIRQFIVYLNSS